MRVLASVLVILFAIDFGFRAAWTAVAACYLVAALTLSPSLAGRARDMLPGGRQSPRLTSEDPL